MDKLGVNNCAHEALPAWNKHTINREDDNSIIQATSKHIQDFKSLEQEYPLTIQSLWPATRSNAPSAPTQPPSLFDTAHDR
eukprot:845840-Heterocapsa_arctica.AAC.1